MTANGTPHADSTHPDLLGAYVMGAADPGERDQVEAHLASCPRCRDEVAELSLVKAVMDGVPRDVVLDHLAMGEDLGPDRGDPADDLVLQRTLRVVRADTSRRRRSRVLAAAAAVIAVGGLTGASGVLVGWATAPEARVEAGPSPSPSPVPPQGRVVRAADASTGVSMTATLTPARAWTRLSVSVDGVPAGTTCRLVAVGADGRREAAASWIVGTPPPGGQRGTVQGSAAITESELASIELLDGEGRRLVVLPA
jgi:hypothetical protein